MGLSKLLGTPDSPIDTETGQVRFENPGIAAACEKLRKRIRALVARLADKAQAPVFDEAFRFEVAEAFEEKKWLIHHRKGESDKKLARSDTSAWQASFKARLDQCPDSLWDFDRIIYYCFREESESEQILKDEIGRARSELEKANAKTNNVSLMPLNYSLGPIDAALKTQHAPRDDSDLRALVADIREFIDRTKTDAGGHVRAGLSRIEAVIDTRAS
jgi:hypothetical protein